MAGRRNESPPPPCPLMDEAAEASGDGREKTRTFDGLDVTDADADADAEAEEDDSAYLLAGALVDASSSREACRGLLEPSWAAAAIAVDGWEIDDKRRVLGTWTLLRGHCVVGRRRRTSVVNQEWERKGKQQSKAATNTTRSDDAGTALERAVESRADSTRPANGPSLHSRRAATMSSGQEQTNEIDARGKEKEGPGVRKLKRSSSSLFFFWMAICSSPGPSAPSCHQQP